MLNPALETNCCRVLHSGTSAKSKSSTPIRLACLAAAVVQLCVRSDRVAIFHIVSSRRGPGQDQAEFRIRSVAGELQAGEMFRCYDTHHPIDFTVLAIQSTADGVVLSCSGFIGFDEQFAGATVDTTKKGRPGGFHYEPI